MDLYFALYETTVYQTRGYTSCLYDSVDRARKQAQVLLDKMKKQYGKNVQCLGIYVFNTGTLKVNRVGALKEGE